MALSKSKSKPAAERVGSSGKSIDKLGPAKPDESAKMRRLKRLHRQCAHIVKDPIRGPLEPMTEKQDRRCAVLLASGRIQVLLGTQEAAGAMLE